MSSIIKFISIVAAVLFTASALLVIFYVYNTGSLELRDFSDSFIKTVGKQSEPDFTSYANQYVDGKTVRSTCEKYGGEYFIRIRTKKNPVSFVVAHKPIKNRIMITTSNTEKFADYSNSSSYYYVGESSLFSSQIVRDDTGTLIGITFTEKGSGRLNKATKTKFALNDNETLVDAKKKYINLVKEDLNSTSSSSLSADLNSSLDASKSIEEQIVELRREILDKQMNENGNHSASFKDAQDKADVAKEEAEAAWITLLASFESRTGKKALGHYAIIKNGSSNDTDDVSDLKFWIKLFERGASE